MYRRKVHYYETDKMGIVHHSNYIRWMEEARVFWLEEIGLPYAKLEEMGLPSPVLAVRCNYKQALKFDEEFLIEVKLKSMTSVKFVFSYTFYNKDKEVTNEGETEHCFTNLEGRPIALKKSNEFVYNKLLEMLDA